MINYYHVVTTTTTVVRVYFLSIFVLHGIHFFNTNSVRNENIDFVIFSLQLFIIFFSKFIILQCFPCLFDSFESRAALKLYKLYKKFFFMIIHLACLSYIEKNQLQIQIFPNLPQDLRDFYQGEILRPAFDMIFGFHQLLRFQKLAGFHIYCQFSSYSLH